jgi:hypothetical protein
MTPAGGVDLSLVAAAEWSVTPDLGDERHPPSPRCNGVFALTSAHRRLLVIQRPD